MKETDEMQLPRGWGDIQLCNFNLIIMGQSPPSNTYNTSGKGLPFYQGKTEFGDLYPTPVKYCSAPNRIAKKGDILISVRAPVGPTNLCDTESCIGRGLAAIRPLGGIDSKFILYLLRSKESEIADKGTGTTFKAISRKTLESLDTSLPPLTEQHRIVAKIEELFSELDNGVAQLQQVQAQLKSYRQSVLKHAFEGKLTEGWRKANPQPTSAAELLTTIQQERQARYQQALKDWQQAVIQWTEAGKRRGAPPGKKPTKPKTPKELPPLTEEEIAKLPDLPKGWMWVKLDKLILSLKNGISKKPSEEGTLPILRISSTRPFNVDLTDRRYLDFDPSYDSYALTNGDLLFTRYNGSRDYVGVCGMVKNLKEKVVYPDKLIRCSVIKENRILPSYIEYTANSGASRKFIVDRIRTTAGQSGVSGGDIYAIPIPLCTTEEQHQIVQEIESRLSVAEHLEQTVEESLRQAEVLRQSILQRAFSGQLVPQDPNDESASELLKRIQREKSDGLTKKVPASSSLPTPNQQLPIAFS